MIPLPKAVRVRVTWRCRVATLWRIRSMYRCSVQSDKVAGSVCVPFIRSGYDVLRIFMAAVLLVAAVLKIHQLPPSRRSEPACWNPDCFLGRHGQLASLWNLVAGR